MNLKSILVLKRLLSVSTAVALVVAVLSVPAYADSDDMGAFIREGSCDTPGNVVEDVGDLDPLDDDDSEWKVLGDDVPKSATVYGEDEGIVETIDDLTSGDHVVTVHASDDENADVIACGKITGDASGDGTLSIDLVAVNDSGYTGRVHFGPSNDSDEATEVTVGVWQDSVATPVASPTS